MIDLTPHRGEIWAAEIPGDKRRPVLILTRSSFIQRLNNVTVAPVVTQIRDIPTEVVVDERHGIDHRSAISFDNVLTIAQQNLIKRVGSLSEAEMVGACASLALALGC